MGYAADVRFLQGTCMSNFNSDQQHNIYDPFAHLFRPKLRMSATPGPVKETPPSVWREDISHDQLDKFMSESELKARNYLAAGMPRQNGNNHLTVSYGGGTYGSIAKGIAEEIRNGYGITPLNEHEEHPEICHNKFLALKCSTPKPNDNYPLRYISAPQYINAYSAICYANWYGLAMDMLVTINLSELGFESPIEADKAFYSLFLKYLSGWSRNHIKPKSPGREPINPIEYSFLPYVCVYESSDKQALHAHILLGIHPRLRENFRQWFGAYKKNTLKARKAPDTALHLGYEKKPNIKAQWNRFSYIFKGLDPEAKVYVPSYGEEKPMSGTHYAKPIPSGYIPEEITLVRIPKRIDKPARNKDKFQSYMELNQFDIRSLYTAYYYDLGCQKTEELLREEEQELFEQEMAERLSKIVI